MEKLTKADLVDHLAETCALTKTAAGAVIDQVVGFIETKTAGGAKVVLKGFGAFEMRKRAPRMGRNPKSGETIQIGATSSMHFKASKAAS